MECEDGLFTAGKGKHVNVPTKNTAGWEEKSGGAFFILLSLMIEREGWTAVTKWRLTEKQITI